MPGGTGTPPRAAGASGQTPERQHLDRHLADKWSQRELQGAREVGGPPGPLCPPSPGVRQAQGTPAEPPGLPWGAGRAERGYTPGKPRGRV